MSEAQFERVQRLMQRGIEEGATLVAGGTGRPEGIRKGFYARPTVFAGVRNDMTIAREEIFGPVLCIIPYDSGSKSADVSSAFSRTGAFGSNSARFCADSPPVIERSSVL